MKKLIFYFLLIQFGIFNPLKAQENIALNKTASQSSTAYGENVGGAAKAVDGNTYSVWTGNSSNSVTHTNQQSNPWWKVDLEGLYDISKINIYNRTACCPERLNGAKVYVGNTNSENPNDYTEVGTLTSSSTVQTFDGLSNKIGQFVLIYLPGNNKILSLAEVEVYGQEYQVEVTNIALNKTASQSSTHLYCGSNYGCQASNANDESLATSSHTHYEDEAWWRVDFGGEYEVTKVEIKYNGSIIFGGANVFVGDTKIGEISSSSNTEESKVFDLPYYIADHLIIKNKYDAFLQLHDVKVFGQEYTGPEEGIAVHKTTIQTNQLSNEYRSSKAVDRSMYTYSSTLYDYKPKFTVDLQNNYDITQVRLKIDNENLTSSATVYIGEASISSDNPNFLTEIGSIDSSKDVFVFDNLEVKGKFIIIKAKDSTYLRFYDIRAYGELSDEEAAISNVALNKPTQQSSSDYYYNSANGHGEVAYFGSNAVNGNYYPYSSESHINPWWRLDLRQPHDITKIEVDAGNSSIGAKVYIGTANSSNPSDYQEVGTINGGSSVFEFNSTNAQHILIRHNNNEWNKKLWIKDVRVIGTADPEHNLALLKHTFQSGSVSGPAAVDGDHSTSTKTIKTNNPWFLVDLGGLYEIDHVNIDITTEGNSPTYMFLGDRIEDTTSNYFHQVSLPPSSYRTYSFQGAKARFIVVARGGENIELEINEISVYGKPADLGYTSNPNIAFNKRIDFSSNAFPTDYIDGQQNLTDNDQKSGFQTNTRSYEGSTEITNSEKPWLLVDLEDQYLLKTIKIGTYFNSYYPYNTHLKDFNIYVGTKNCIDESKFHLVSAIDQTTLVKDYDVSGLDDANRTARYILIKSSNKDAVLSFSTLRVNGQLIGAKKTNNNPHNNFLVDMLLDINLNDQMNESMSSFHSNISGPIDIYPNPNNGQFTLAYSAKSEGEIVIQIVDITGRLVQSCKHYAAEGGQKIKAAVILDESVREGLYLLSITHSNGSKETIRIQKN